MKTKVIFNFLLLGFVLLSFTNCEIEAPATEIAAQNTTKASFVSEKILLKVSTADRLQGTWMSNQSGTKYKWIIQDDKLYKNIIYSFGTASEPQEYTVTYLDGFDGNIDDNGSYILIKHIKSEQGIAYKILKVTNQYITLSSKFNEIITLERF